MAVVKLIFCSLQLDLANILSANMELSVSGSVPGEVQKSFFLIEFREFESCWLSDSGRAVRNGSS